MEKSRMSAENRTRRNLLQIGAKIAGIAGAAMIGGLKPKEAKASPPCFLRGTLIKTSDGECRVEDLKVGDLLPTMFGGLRPIKWIGRYGYKRSDCAKPWVKDVLPVRIARSAVAPNIPARDLCVTKWHALYVDDVLVPAGSLVNGTSITIDGSESRSELEFFHIKFDTHDVIFAEGMPCESLLITDGASDNFVEYVKLYGEPSTPELPCAEILSFNGGRSEVKSRFRSALSPWIDRRTQLDVIRDTIEERGITLADAVADA